MLCNTDRVFVEVDLDPWPEVVFARGLPCQAVLSCFLFLTVLFGRELPCAAVLKEWGLRSPSLRPEQLHKLFWILPWPLEILSVASRIPLAQSYHYGFGFSGWAFVFVFSTFLLSGFTTAPGSSCIFHAPVLESQNQPFLRALVPFDWRMIVETKIWTLAMDKLQLGHASALSAGIARRHIRGYEPMHIHICIKTSTCNSMYLY